ncbi:radical SAM protein [Geofilum rubicundum JCM 15548]|uniref:Heme chaperone HemW n=2 Tax=Geofilum TaxID=1236988 RepID=A0A0E9M166_9BACT|nr:radical SAM protein [Geofilum rubicundum JCM 15548]
MEPFFNTLKQEIVHYAPLFTNRIETLYFGGGTPSLLKSGMYTELFLLLKSYYSFNTDVEITIEANPDDLTPTYIDDLLALGFNRISIGIQSFNETDLQEMGRRHSSSQALQSIQNAYNGGFRNIGMDLIYGLPWSSTEAFEKNLEIFKTLPVNHLSAYHLTFEEGTPFERLLKRGVYQEMKDNKSLAQYELLCRLTANNGFEHYEVSNFSQPGYRSRHNSSYWNGSPYIGFGPGSHSYYKGKRSWNKPDLATYNKGHWADITEEETLNKDDLFNESIMLGLRTSDGIDLEQLQNLHPAFYEAFSKKQIKWLTAGDLYLAKNRLICHEKSWFIVDSIIKDLFI